MQARSGSGLLDPLMTGDPGAAGLRWLWALVAHGGWPAHNGQGHDRSARPPRAEPADPAAGSGPAAAPAPPGTATRCWYLVRINMPAFTRDTSTATSQCPFGR